MILQLQVEGPVTGHLVTFIIQNVNLNILRSCIFDLYFSTVLVIVPKTHETSTNIPRYCTVSYLYIWVIDQAWDQDGWILDQVLFLRVYGPRRSREPGQYPGILTEQAWSIKDLLYDLKHQKMIFDLAGRSEKSRAGKIAPLLTFKTDRLDLRGLDLGRSDIINSIA